MKAIVLDFRGGKSTQKCNQCLGRVRGVDTKALASRLLGKRVVCKTASGKAISGKVMRTHGNNGVVCARFARGLSIGDLRKGIEILE